MMRNGVIRDGCTLAAWGLYLLVEGAAGVRLYPRSSMGIYGEG